MNRKEKENMAIQMSILLDSIMNANYSEDVANNAISFVVYMLKNFPELRKLIEIMYADDWDEYTAWIDWEKQMLS
jgi:hypothetical protein